MLCSRPTRNKLTSRANSVERHRPGCDFLPKGVPSLGKKFRDPVCPLISLYGHPDSGGYWERHCQEHLTRHGFKEITAWRSCYMHEKLQLFLVVYVDDFKLAGPVKNLDKGWQLIRQRVRTEDPTLLEKYLGCTHVETSRVVDMSSPQFAPFMWPVPLPERHGSGASAASARGDGADGGGGSPVGGKTPVGAQNAPKISQKGRVNVRCLEV